MEKQGIGSRERGSEPGLPHRCEECGSEGAVYMSPRCHPGSPVYCLLDKDVLTLECALCRQLVCRLRVASKPLSEEAAHGKEKTKA
jgi:hypothetical protein